MLNAGQVLSREQLLDHVWGLDFDPDSNVVDVYVGYLRMEFGAEAITTARGMGGQAPRAADETAHKPGLAVRGRAARPDPGRVSWARPRC